MIPIKTDRPVKFETTGRAISPELVEAFFKHGFSPEERKYKVLFLVIATTGLRIGEVVALNLKDFVPDTNLSQFWVNLEKKRKANTIVKRVLPEATASVLRAWIRDKFYWISASGGWIFPKPQRKIHVSTHNARDFLAKKRKQLAKMLPHIGFSEVFGVVPLNKPCGFGKSMEQKLYKFTIHSFRHFYSRWISRDPEIAMRILRHENIKTTLQYRQQHDLLKQEAKLVNELFNEKFFDSINNPAEHCTAVWKF